MNIDSSEDYLRDFYGPESHWFAITLGVISTLVVLSNSFFIIITLTSPTLRSKSSNWFLVGFAVSDFLHGLTQLFDMYAIWNGSIDNRYLCSLVGTFDIMTFTSSFGFPFLISADRFYKITISESGRWSLGGVLFSDRFIIPIILSWFSISWLSNLPLILNNGFGEDPGGFCGAKKFTEVSKLLMYEFSSVSVFCGGLFLAAFYYFRLAKWLEQNHHTTNLQGTRLTREIMMITKITAMIPVFLGTPAVILTAGQMILPEMPMWVKRAITTPYFLTAFFNPWVTMCLVRPFRRRIAYLLCSATVAASSETTDRVINVSSQHPRLILIPLVPRPGTAASRNL